MTEQQYRVTADRDKGDDPIEQWRASGVAYFENRAHGEVGKWWLNQIRHIFGAESLAAVRIERPAPTPDEVRPSTPWHKQFAAWLSGCDIDPSPSEAFRAGWLASEPSLPTREQIAEAQASILRQVAAEWAADPAAWGDNDRDYRNELRDRADALLQKAADR